MKKKPTKKKHTTKKDSANLLAMKPSLNLSSKKQNKLFQSIKSDAKTATSKRSP